MNHYLEIISIDREFETFFEIILHTGQGSEVYAGSHSLARIENQADHIADVLAINANYRMKIINNAKLTGSVAL
jgi:hypothetical protein